MRSIRTTDKAGRPVSYGIDRTGTPWLETCDRGRGLPETRAVIIGYTSECLQRIAAEIAARAIPVPESFLQALQPVPESA